MQITKTQHIGPEEREAIRRTWNNEYPASLRLETPADFDAYLAALAEQVHYLVFADNALSGWGTTFVRDGERWFAMILDGSIHGKGFGSQLLQTMQADNTALLGWVIDHGTAEKSGGELYRSPLPFYEKNGFTVQSGIRLEIPTLSAVRIAWASANNTL